MYLQGVLGERTQPSLAGKLVKLAGSAVVLVAVFALARNGSFEPRKKRCRRPGTEVCVAGTVRLHGWLRRRHDADDRSVRARPLALGAAADSARYCFRTCAGTGHRPFPLFFACHAEGSARDDLQLILFSTLIMLLMVGGTLVVLFNLQLRMM